MSVSSMYSSLAPIAMGLGVAWIVLVAILTWIKTREQRAKFNQATRELSRELTREVYEAVLPDLRQYRTQDAAPKLQPESDIKFSERRSDTTTTEVVKPKTKPPDKNVKHEAVLPAQQNQWMVIVVTLLVLLSALFVILSNNAYDEGTKRWAYGAVGLVAGYWLNNKRH